MQQSELNYGERDQFLKGVACALPFEKHFVRKRLPKLIRGDESYASKRLGIEGIEAVSMLICAYGWMSYASLTLVPGIILTEVVSANTPLGMLGRVVLVIGCFAMAMSALDLFREYRYRVRFQGGVR